MKGVSPISSADESHPCGPATSSSRDNGWNIAVRLPPYDPKARRGGKRGVIRNQGQPTVERIGRDHPVMQFQNLEAQEDVPCGRWQGGKSDVPRGTNLVEHFLHDDPRMGDMKSASEGDVDEIPQGDLREEQAARPCFCVPERPVRGPWQIVLEVLDECHRVQDEVRQSLHSFRSFRRSSSNPFESIFPLRKPRRLDRPCLIRMPSPASRTTAVSPSLRWYFSRSSFGRVICPFELIVAAFAMETRARPRYI